MNTGRVALIAGSTGIVGGNLAALLVEQGWTVYGLARRPSSTRDVIPIGADLRDRSALVAALVGSAPTHVFFCSAGASNEQCRASLEGARCEARTGGAGREPA